MNKRVVLGFLLLLVVYQSSEGLQTVVARGNPLGPALMLLALALAWPVGRWIDGSGWRAFGLLRPRWLGLLGGGLLLAILAKFAAEALALGLGIETFAPMLALPVSALGLLALTTFIRYSRMGRACRACAEDLKMASLLGINTDRVISLTFVIGAAMAA